MSTSLSEGEPKRPDALQYSTPSPAPSRNTLPAPLRDHWPCARAICQKIEANAELTSEEEEVFALMERHGIYLDLLTLADLEALAPQPLAVSG